MRDLLAADPAALIHKNRVEVIYLKYWARFSRKLRVSIGFAI